jgi:nucleotide-binding universal stress UspA family protein
MTSPTLTPRQRPEPSNGPVRGPETISVGVDGSINSRAALLWALAHAQPGDTITLVHAWQAPPSTSAPLVDRDSAAQAAQALAERERARADCLPRADHVTLDAIAIEANPSQCLAGLDCHMIVVGARGHNPISELLLGSVPTHLARHCHRPVVIVPHAD